MRGNRIFDPTTWLPKRQPQPSRRSFVVASGSKEDIFSRYPDWAIQVVEMKPDYFLVKTVNRQFYGRSMASIRGHLGDVPHLEERIDNDMELDIPELVVRARTRRVIMHDGRHRALAASNLGLPAIPVGIVYYDDASAPIDLRERPDVMIDPSRPDFKPQQWGA